MRCGQARCSEYASPLPATSRPPDAGWRCLPTPRRSPRYVVEPRGAGTERGTNPRADASREAAAPKDRAHALWWRRSFNWAQTRAMRPSTLLMASAGGERHRLQDPARALRLAIRNYDEPKVARLTDWLLNGVPLQWDEQYPLARCRVIRGRVAPGDDGFAFALDKATGVVTEVRRPDEVSQMSKGDRVVTVDGVPLGAVPLGEAVEPESVVEVGLWRGGEMAALRRRLAQRSLDDGVVEVAKLACMGEPDPHPAPKPEPKPKP